MTFYTQNNKAFFINLYSHELNIYVSIFVCCSVIVFKLFFPPNTHTHVFVSAKFIERKTKNVSPENL